MSAPLPKNTRLIVIRRGELMRVLFPVDPVELYKIMPRDLAMEAMLQVLNLQVEYPGRADMPITSRTGEVGLTFRDSDYVLDPDVNVAVQCEGRWEEMKVSIAVEGTPYQNMPCVLMALDDIHD